MPINATYQVQCDVCFGYMDGEYETREDAEAARKELGWEDTYNRTACPEHNTNSTPPEPVPPARPTTKETP